MLKSSTLVFLDDLPLNMSKAYGFCRLRQEDPHGKWNFFWTEEERNESLHLECGRFLVTRPGDIRSFYP